MISSIIEATASYFAISKENLLNGRDKLAVRAHNIALYLARTLTEARLLAIAEAFGKTCATVLHGVKVVSQVKETSPEVSRAIAEITAHVNLRHVPPRTEEDLAASRAKLAAVLAAKARKDQESEVKPMTQAWAIEKVRAFLKDDEDDFTEKRMDDEYVFQGIISEANVKPVDTFTFRISVGRFYGTAREQDPDAPRLNLLLSGPPGTGKSAFVQYLASRVKAPLEVVKASDLLSHFHGKTERNIAAAFKRAKERKAILFLDEIDSFLQSREGSTYSWEVTQVNELLQQMESFGGVMVGATNFVERLDKAVLRRFTYKLKLDYLTDEGKAVFFGRYFKTPLTEAERTRLDAIANLAPGDFRTVRQQLYYLVDKPTNEQYLEALETESVAKGEARAKVGF